MKIRFNTEDWREQITGWVEGGNDESTPDYIIDEAAEDLSERVISRLRADGFGVEQAYSQSVGNGAIFQSGTDAEREEFDHALENERNETTLRTDADDRIRSQIIEVSGDDWDDEVLRNAVAAVKRGDKQFLIDQAANSLEADALIALIDRN